MGELFNPVAPSSGGKFTILQSNPALTSDAHADYALSVVVPANSLQTGPLAGIVVIQIEGSYGTAAVSSAENTIALIVRNSVAGVPSVAFPPWADLVTFVNGSDATAPPFPDSVTAGNFLFGCGLAYNPTGIGNPASQIAMVTEIQGGTNLSNIALPIADLPITPDFTQETLWQLAFVQKSGANTVPPANLAAGSWAPTATQLILVT